MKQIPYTAPQYTATAYNCPFCHAYAKQTWSEMGRYYQTGRWFDLDTLRLATCDHCNQLQYWVDGLMVVPAETAVEPPNPDMDEAIRGDYLEAAHIYQKSPRGAAALLRLVIQKLCEEQLRAKGGNLNEMIGDLVKRGLPIKVQESLDALRVIGNEAVHPGTLDIKDDQEIAAALFGLVNLIVDRMISADKAAENIYSKVPAEQKAAIKKRDGLSKT